jgi:hypothetical protein
VRTISAVVAENASNGKVGEMEMSYKSPIEVIQSQRRNQIEGEIYRAVMNVGVNVDKDELIKALQYDRGQYQKGYEDRDSQIVRCKDCKHGEPCKNGLGEDAIECFDSDICLEVRCRRPNWFCANGELKE